MILSSIKDFFSIKDIGFLEMIVALYPIVAGYGYGSFQLAFGLLFIIEVILLVKYGNRKIDCKPLITFSVYIILHNIVWLFVVKDISSHFVNSIIADFIYLSAVIVISPFINQSKLKNAIKVVALVCAIGMLYHVAIIQMGHSVSPIKLPFFPEMAKTSRLYAEVNRPTSFFWEPQSYSSFMTVPLFYALRDKNMLWALFIALTMVMSTSTTGIIMAMLMLGAYVATQKQSFMSRLLIIAMGVAVVFFLLNSEYASSGLDKINNTNLEETNRTINGVLVVQDLNLMDLILGIPYFSLQEAYDANYLSSSVIVMADGEMFASAFWICLICHGIVGLILFMRVYIHLYKQAKVILPYLACIIVGLFSNPDYVGASWVFQLFIMIAFVRSVKENPQKSFSC